MALNGAFGAWVSKRFLACYMEDLHRESTGCWFDFCTKKKL